MKRERRVKKHTLNTDQLLAGLYRPLDPVEGQGLGARVQINEFGDVERKKNDLCPL